MAKKLSSRSRGSTLSKAADARHFSEQRDRVINLNPYAAIDATTKSSILAVNAPTSPNANGTERAGPNKALAMLKKALAVLILLVEGSDRQHPLVVGSVHDNALGGKAI